ncbi:transcription factor 7-like 2 isoform X2 [Tubulanus polymorphus]|uniref:transcription factor 7-like 2 isoform X2 n=1 Tax=Tubulanus polymorphus TaxID=672921 RepID=UPI003DA42C12
MPHVSSGGGGGDDLASTDEVKVYKDEGEDEKRSSENYLSEDKLGLVTETEEEKSSTIHQQGPGYSEKDEGTVNVNRDGKSDPSVDRPGPLPNYIVTSYPYTNGATPVGSLGYFPVYSPHGYQTADALSLGNKVSVVQPTHPGSLAHLMMYNNDQFSPPPAHMGIPPVPIDPKTGLPRPPMYPIPPHPSQYTHPMYSPEFSQVQWQGPPTYPATTSGYRGPYPLVANSAALRFNHTAGLIHPPHGMHHGIPHPAIVTPGPKQDIQQHSQTQENHRHPTLHEQGRNDLIEQPEPPAKKQPHIKKPLNAFMLFMKEQRAKVVAECTLKESAAINQILGRKWHALDRSEQAKYYEMARKEKELHMQLYPGWSARDNYACHSKRKKRKKDSPGENKNADSDCSNPKKCRARFGVDHQSQWCKPCRRKKKCIRFLTDEDDDGVSDDLEDAEGPDSFDEMNMTNIAKADSTNDTDLPESSSPLNSSRHNSNVDSDTELDLQQHDVIDSSSSQHDMQPSSSTSCLSTTDVSPPVDATEPPKTVKIKSESSSSTTTQSTRV